jgi:hypothetical protein
VPDALAALADLLLDRARAALAATGERGEVYAPPPAEGVRRG